MPFYQYNSFTGRLKPSTSFQPLYPIRAEPPMAIYDTIKTKPITVTSKAGYCTDKPPTLSPKMWEKYKYYQSVIDKPVYLAGGRKDKILFGITVGLTVYCTLCSVKIVLEHLGVIDRKQ